MLEDTITKIGLKMAYVTVLTNERYIPGVMALVKSLYIVKSQYPIVIVVPDAERALLTASLEKYGVLQFNNAIIITRPSINGDCHANSKKRAGEYDYWKDTFFKLAAVNLVQFEKIVLIDSDILVNQNIDCLFEMSNMSAVMAGFCERTTWKHLNSGLLVIEPNNEYYETLLQCIEPAIKRKESQQLNVGDQDVFQEANQDWSKQEELHLPETYNCLYGMINSVCKVNKCSPYELKIIHFVGKVKPWDHGRFFVFKMFVANILKGGDKKNLLARLKLWQKYWNYCQPIK